MGMLHHELGKNGRVSPEIIADKLVFISDGIFRFSIIRPHCAFLFLKIWENASLHHTGIENDCYADPYGGSALCQCAFTVTGAMPILESARFSHG